MMKLKNDDEQGSNLTGRDVDDLEGSGVGSRRHSSLLSPGRSFSISTTSSVLCYTALFILIVATVFRETRLKNSINTIDVTLSRATSPNCSVFRQPYSFTTCDKP